MRKNQIIQHLDSLIAKSIANGDIFKVPPDNELVPGGKHAMYLLNDIKKAAYLALRDRQTIALKFLTSEEGGHWSQEQASGIVANLTIESFLDPQKNQEDGGKGIRHCSMDHEWSEVSGVPKDLRKKPCGLVS